MSNQLSNLMKKNKRDNRRSRLNQEAHEDQSGHEHLRQSGGVGVIAPNYADIIYLYNTSLFIDK